MIGGVINILMDSTSSICMSHDEVEQAMTKNVDYIETNCSEFFNFDVLDNHYDVIVHRGNGTIVLSALLDETNTYTVKRIRRAHNVHKMLLAGGFKFKEI